MTGPAVYSEFCFPSTSMSPSVLPRETLRVSGKLNSLFPLGPVIKCDVTSFSPTRNWGKQKNLPLPLHPSRVQQNVFFPTGSTQFTIFTAIYNFHVWRKCTVITQSGSKISWMEWRKRHQAAEYFSKWRQRRRVLGYFETKFIRKPCTSEAETSVSG